MSKPRRQWKHKAKAVSYRTVPVTSTGAGRTISSTDPALTQNSKSGYTSLYKTLKNVSGKGVVRHRAIHPKLKVSIHQLT